MPYWSELGKSIAGKNPVVLIVPFSILHIQLKFIADAQLGKLAKWLRILGYDTLYFREKEITKLIEEAKREERIILTRKSHLRKLLAGKMFLFITQDQPLLQLKEVIHAYNIKKSKEAFSRCLHCNHPLEKIAKTQIEGKVPEFVYITQHNFFTCFQCNRIYWPGTHLQRMKEKIDSLY
jgi:uncharacterized protein